MACERGRSASVLMRPEASALALAVPRLEIVPNLLRADFGDHPLRRGLRGLFELLLGGAPRQPEQAPRHCNAGLDRQPRMPVLMRLDSARGRSTPRPARRWRGGAGATGGA